jgi:hypothetical protein
MGRLAAVDRNTNEKSVRSTMLTQRSWAVAGSLAVIVVMLAGAASGQEQKSPAQKPGKQTDPLQPLRDAFAKGVTVTPVDPKDLPREITTAVAKLAPGASVKKAQKQEIRLTLKYVALDQPKVQWYQATVTKDDKRLRLQLAPDGKKRAVQQLAAGKETPNTKKAPARAGKEIDIPPRASKAVEAIKALYPDAVVKQITTEVYQDPSGTVDVLTYEIEFITKGTEREMVASPEGVIPHLHRAIAEKDLPKAVQASLAKEVPGGKLENATQFEIRAGLQFVPLDKPRIVYRLELEKDGKPSKLQLRADGTVVPPPVRPGPKRAFLGVTLEKNTTTVSQVSKDSPAERAGVRPGDKILALGTARIAAVTDLLRALQALQPGTEVNLEIQRGEKAHVLRVKLGGPGSP